MRESNHFSSLFIVPVLRPVRSCRLFSSGLLLYILQIICVVSPHNIVNMKMFWRTHFFQTSSVQPILIKYLLFQHDVLVFKNGLVLYVVTLYIYFIFHKLVVTMSVHHTKLFQRSSCTCHHFNSPLT